MAGSPKEKLAHAEAETVETEGEREIMLRDGKKLVVGESGTDQYVEIRNESGMLEVRIKLTESGPVLQMESLKLSMKAAEEVSIDATKISIRGETINLDAGTLSLGAEEDIKVDAKNEVRVVGRMIYLN